MLKEQQRVLEEVEKKVAEEELKDKERQTLTETIVKNSK